MSIYAPAKAAIPKGIDFTRQLSQRDLSAQIPINFVQGPAVVLTSACFSNDRYVEASATTCVSNLLAVGFSRIVVDVYWDSSRSVWSLCPAELRATAGLELERRLLPGAARQDRTNGQSLTFASTFAAQSGSTLPSASTTTTLSAGSNRTSTADGPAQTISNPSGTIIDVGPYSCQLSANLDLLLDVLSSHITSTQTNVNATIKYLVLNLHAATIPGSSTVNLTHDHLPDHDQHISRILENTTNLTNFLYTPTNLTSQRQDLNSSSSWYGVPPSKEPDSAYFTVSKTGSHGTTDNGWPSESFVEMTQAKRLLVGFGSIANELKGYNITVEEDTIFPPGYLESPTDVVFSAQEQLSSGCFFDANTEQVSSVNNSWALSVLGSTTVTGLQSVLNATSSLTNCGISPILNRSLSGATADQDISPYKNFVQNTIWSWAAGQPIHRIDHNVENPEVANRCAAMSLQTGYWQTEDCAGSYYSACRVPGQPYNWSISRSNTMYQDSGITCDEGTSFDVPRTALENRYLHHTWQNFATARSLTDGNELLWVDFNDLDVNGCWVIGQNATCPYLNNNNDKRDVLVPTVAGVIVFVIAMLTVFVKCAANRRNKKRRRRRGDDGWDYEGVPS